MSERTPINARANAGPEPTPAQIEAATPTNDKWTVRAVVVALAVVAAIGMGGLVVRGDPKDVLVVTASAIAALGALLASTRSNR